MLTSDTATSRLMELFQQALTDSTLIKLRLSDLRQHPQGLQRIEARPLLLKNHPHLSVVSRFATQEMTKNFPQDQGWPELLQLLADHAHTAFLETSAGSFQWQRHSNQRTSLSRQGKPKPSPNTTPTGAKPSDALILSTGHQRHKKRFVAQDAPFLHRLGITDERQQIIPSMSRKWKQINKFIEIFDSAWSSTADHHLLLNTTPSDHTHRPLHIVDFGSGKGYLTFAIHDFIHRQSGTAPVVTGVELREELVAFCSQAARDLPGLHFFQGDVQSFQPEQVDVMIALHACDIATDFALHTGIRLGASVIMTAPCCHKEIRPQLKPPAPLSAMLSFGVHLGQEAEMLTDSLRALWLEAAGYETRILEFVSLEHTSKNKMILGIKKPANAHKQHQAREQIQALKTFYGVEKHTLERLLNASPSST